MLAKFTNFHTAERFSHRTDKASAIVLGDDERYWVVTLATMETLLATGYQLAV